MLPTGLLDHGRIVDQAAATEGNDTREDEPLMQAAGGEVPTWVEPKARLERQVRVLKEPTRGDPDTTHEEAAEVPALDNPPVVEATGGVIEMGMVEVPECPEGMTPGNVDESPKTILAPMPILPPHLEEYQDMPELEDAEPGTIPAPMPVLLPCLKEYQDMPELEDAEPEDDLREEPLMNVPPAKTGMDLRGLPPLDDGRSREDREESLADIPWIEEPLAQPWVRFEAQIRQDEVQHWAAMFMWFWAMHLQWEENRRKRVMTSVMVHRSTPNGNLGSCVLSHVL